MALLTANVTVTFPSLTAISAGILPATVIINTSNVRISHHLSTLMEKVEAPPVYKNDFTIDKDGVPVLMQNTDARFIWL